MSITVEKYVHFCEIDPIYDGIKSIELNGVKYINLDFIPEETEIIYFSL